MTRPALRRVGNIEGCYHDRPSSLRPPELPGATRRVALRRRAMQDLLWIATMAGLVAATLAYARLCDHA
jgi:hypothetical protein